MVAPLAGARIEIEIYRIIGEKHSVAPLAGARIEIICSPGFSIDLRSLPSRERGLKSKAADGGESVTWSLPSRERGLKYASKDNVYSDDVSLPSRERGLKSSAPQDLA